MKIFRRVLFVILILIVSFILCGYFLPRNLAIHVDTQINASPYQVYKQIYDLRNWNNWCIWLNDSTLEPIGLKVTNSETINQTSFVSKNLGQCTIKTIATYPFDSLLFNLEFNKYGNSLLTYRLAKDDSLTRLKCIFNSNLGNNPLNRWISLYYRKRLTNELLSNLNNLRLYIDNHIDRSIMPEEKRLPQRFMLYDTITVAHESLSNQIPLLYERLGKQLKRSGIKVIGHPAVSLHPLNDTLVHIKAGFISDSGTNITYYYPILSDKVVTATYSGAYSGIQKAYSEIESYIFMKGLLFGGEIWEEYLTDPTLEQDSTRLKTIIYYTLK